MTVNLPILPRVIIAKPCSVKWEDMHGDDTVRHCAHCNLNVFNFSNMKSADAESLLRSTEGRLCATFYRRADGTILTRDCPVGVAAARAAFVRGMTRMGAVAAALISTIVIGRSRDQYGDHLSLTSQNPFMTFARIAGKTRPRIPTITGGIVMYTPPPAPPPPSKAVAIWNSLFGGNK